MDVLGDINTGLRGATLGLLVLMSCHLAFGAPRARISWVFIAMNLGLAGYVTVSASACPPGGCAPNVLLWIGIVLAMLAPVLVWWAALELFELAEPVLRLVPVVVAVLLGLALLADTWPLSGTLFRVVIICLYAHLLIVAWQSAPGDLVEARRQFRRWLTVAAAMLGLTIMAVELTLPDSAIGTGPRALLAAAIFALVLAFAVWLFRVRDAFWPTSTGAAKPVALSPAIPPADRALMDRLEAAMADDVWRREGLTIGALAAELETPEHRLRQVINRQLGYRNFARFINERRVAAAQAMLTDPGQADKPILTIAYDCGFASLGPFNRAFRDITGQSPSAYRAANS